MLVWTKLKISCRELDVCRKSKCEWCGKTVVAAYLDGGGCAAVSKAWHSSRSWSVSSFEVSWKI